MSEPDVVGVTVSVSWLYDPAFGVHVVVTTPVVPMNTYEPRTYAE